MEPSAVGRHVGGMSGPRGTGRHGSVPCLGVRLAALRTCILLRISIGERTGIWQANRERVLDAIAGCWSRESFIQRHFFFPRTWGGGAM